jgi:putative tryptophan/tyrosine transport system substrate-binding protein
MITRRQFLAFGAAAAMAHRAAAQTRPVRIGILGSSPFEASIYASGVVRSFAELGYAEGARATFEHRFAEDSFESYRRHAQELVALKCDLLIGLRSEPAARALQFAQRGQPIVFLAVDYDPLERGVVINLRRPDRNATGVSVPQNALVARRVEILRHALPTANRLMVFADRHSADQVDAARKAAAAARFQLVLIQFQDLPYDYASYLRDSRWVDADSFMCLASPVFARDRREIHEAIMRMRLPSIGTNPLQAEAGFLLALGSNVAKVTRRVAEVGARLLGGTSPADIPVEQVSDYDVVLNSTTARMLDLKVPDAVLKRVTRVVT